MQFILPSNKWSQSSVFSRHGNYLCDWIEKHFTSVRHSDVRGGDQYPSPLVHERAEHRITQKNRVDEVADAIRSLGYTVSCREHDCITWAEASQSEDLYCGGAYRGSMYCIMDIQKPCGEYVYGGSETNRKLTGSNNVMVYGTKNEETIAMEMGAWDAYNYVQKLLNDYGENPSLLVSEIPPYVHTIGNTLPIDIVVAIQEFSSSDPDFFPEPDDEFVMPQALVQVGNNRIRVLSAGRLDGTPLVQPN